MSKVSRQTPHGGWQTMPGQGSLDASLGIISGRLLQKQCSSVCACCRSTWVMSPGIESHMPNPTNLRQTWTGIHALGMNVLMRV